jgi:hypothetical protein
MHGRKYSSAIVLTSTRFPMPCMSPDAGCESEKRCCARFGGKGGFPGCVAGRICDSEVGERESRNSKGRDNSEIVAQISQDCWSIDRDVVTVVRYLVVVKRKLD